MSEKQLVYIVEDDASIRELEIYALKNSEFEVKGFESGKSMMAQLENKAADIILLDIMLPEEDGLTILNSIRQTPAYSEIPVIMVTAKTSEIDAVKGLDMGADDYISKPFGTSELLARIRAAIRRFRGTNKSQDGKQYLSFLNGKLIIDHDKHRVFRDGEDANLTQNEFRLVSLLGKYSGKVLTYDFIIKEIWGPNMTGDNRILRVNMANIRRKIEENPGNPQFIFTEVGVGYRIVETDVSIN